MTGPLPPTAERGTLKLMTEPENRQEDLDAGWLYLQPLRL